MTDKNLKLRKDALAALRNLREHSPTWVEIIRRYIRHLERQNKDGAT